MSTRKQINQGDGDEYAAAPAIASDVLRSLVTAVTQAMTTAIANATVPVPVTPNTITYYSTIDPYGDKFSETKTKEGKYRWHLTTKTSKGWKHDGISATVTHAKNILDLFKDLSVQLGLDNITNIPTSGTGAVHANPQKIIGVDHWNMDVRDYIYILTSYHQLPLDQVRDFSGWFMGDETSSLTKSSDMKINPLTRTRPETLAS